MRFISSDEIIPEMHQRGFENLCGFSPLGGFVGMMYLDATLGCAARADSRLWT
ncbi:MAG: hypothetical protein OEO19_08285 [Gammaproteobacteria bacterium]|nr:hypothetical protein [Gammaproteobacteria bacterium]MDH3447391.1 hypothetical protein [Gammaproteobacteria bacterium]